MGFLHDFLSKDFVEQVSLLSSLDASKDQGSIPDLISLISRIPEHEAVVLVLKDTLKRLLSDSQEQTVRHLASEREDIRKICIEVAGQKQFASAAQALRSIALKALETKDSRTLSEVIKAVSQIHPEQWIDLFRENLAHEDPTVSSLCIEILGRLNDAPSLERMRAMVIEAERESHGGQCDLPTASAIRALGTSTPKDSIPFFISWLHHQNPGVRRVIHHELSLKGNDAIDALSAVFAGESVDEKIFAANILGIMGTKEAGDVLVKAIDTNRPSHPNIRYAIYEALGTTRGMSALVSLADGLAETDQMVLLAVLWSLGAHLNQGILDQIAGMIRKGTDHSELLIRSIIASGAMNIFEGLYRADEAIASLLMEEISHLRNEEQIKACREMLAGIGSVRAQADLKTLEGLGVGGQGLSILAVDDSKAMLNFYKSVASSIRCSITTALNGREALDIISSGKQFNLIITDMNMPVMDGVEFTRQVRSEKAFKDVPVIMVTTESERSQEDLARKAGVDHFMRKPFDAQKLKDRILGCL